MSQTFQDLNCPNCGAPYELSPGSNVVNCAHCGTQIFLPQSLVAQSPAPETISVPAWDPQTKKRIVRWVWIIVGIVLAVTVIPPLCTLVFTVCVSLFTVLASIPR